MSIYKESKNVAGVFGLIATIHFLIWTQSKRSARFLKKTDRADRNTKHGPRTKKHPNGPTLENGEMSTFQRSESQTDRNGPLVNLTQSKRTETRKPWSVLGADQKNITPIFPRHINKKPGPQRPAKSGPQAVHKSTTLYKRVGLCLTKWTEKNKIMKTKKCKTCGRPLIEIDQTPASWDTRPLYPSWVPIYIALVGHVLQVRHILNTWSEGDIYGLSPFTYSENHPPIIEEDRQHFYLIEHQCREIYPLLPFPLNLKPRKKRLGKPPY